MGVSLDLRKAHAHHHFGEIVQILTWVNDERAMVLLPAFRKNAPWYIVCDSAAWKYADDKYLISQSKKAADVLGMGESSQSWLKIAAIIEEGLADLVRMPSAPAAEMLKASFGEMKMSADGKVFAHQDIKLENDHTEYVQGPLH